MQKSKTFIYYAGWSIFWIIVLAGAIWFSVETKTFRFTAPIMFITFIGYAFYVMLKTKPELSTKHNLDDHCDEKCDCKEAK